jgi:uncharacterized membrane-anchored protein YjiN (DUF445 family)
MPKPHGTLGYSVMGESMNEETKRRQLRRMKAIALAMLVAAAVVFVVAKSFEDRASWIGYVRATAEAAMVGALADWFAVTALFRRPLGLPIPHTAIIPERKNEIGESLGEFVQENFLSTEVIGEKLREAHATERAARWLAKPENADRVGAQASTAVSGLVDVLRDDDVSSLIDQMVSARLATIDVAPIAGRALDVMTESGRHHELFDAGLAGLGRALNERREVLRTKFASESPWWVPEPIDSRVFDKIFNGVQSLIGDVLRDPNHELRAEVDLRLRRLVEELRTSPEMAVKGAELRDELLQHPAVRSWSASLWADLKGSLVRQSADPDSTLRRRMSSSLVSLAETIGADPELQTKVDRWLESAVGYVAEQYRGEVAKLISSTVEKWDPADTSERIELQIGKDLQFIRMNGTVVGGLVGLLLHVAGALL